MSGHPGATDRVLTLAQLKQQRNLELPQWLLRYSEIRGRYIQFSAQSPQNERITADQLNGIENAIKVRRKMLDALHEDSLLARKAAEEDDAAQADRREGRRAQEEHRRSVGRHRRGAGRRARAVPAVHLSSRTAPVSRAGSSTYARTLVRGAAERDKPNGQRFREFTDSALPRIEQQLGARVPVYPELEELRLGNSLERMREWLGPDHPVVRKLLSKESPAALAKRLVTETKLADPAVRLELWKGGSAAIAASTDPMIVLARSIDADARAVRKAYEDGVEAPRALRHRTHRARRASPRWAPACIPTPRSRCA